MWFIIFRRISWLLEIWQHVYPVHGMESQHGLFMVMDMQHPNFQPLKLVMLNFQIFFSIISL